MNANDDHRPSRRQFIAIGASAAAALATASLYAQSDATQPSPRKVMHVIGHSHIDAAWLWPWRDGADLAITTFRSALDRMNETPGFKYVHSSAIHYRWVQRADPKMFEEIRGRIAEGRWQVVGGWPVEPDCNIPSAESFVRHSLYGKAYLKDALGVDVNIGFNPDAFGHSAGLPTLLKRAGYDYYAFQRPQETEMDLPLLFWWEGPDGSRLLSCRIYKTYDSDIRRLPDAAEHGFAAGFNDSAYFFGVGDHGGAVTKDQLKQLLALRSDATLPELRFSTLGEFFAAVERSPAFSSLPVIKGELQHHARGCYSAYGEGKFQNRRAERSLGIAETVSAVANLAIAYPYPKANFTDAWWKVLFNQFHDLLAGTSLYSDYQDVRDGIGWACETATTSKVEALHAMAKRVNTRSVPESAVFLFNPLPWSRKALMEIHIKKTPKADPQITHLQPEKGDAVPIQIRPADSPTDSYPRLAAWVELPPCGYRVLQIAHGDPPSPAGYKDLFAISEKSFGISSIWASDGIELLAAPLGLVVIKDASDTWSHGVAAFREELGRPAFVSSTVVEDGPVMRVTRQRAQWQSSEIVLDITQFAGIDAIQLQFVINWHEHEQMLKLEIPTRFTAPAVHAKVAGAVIARKTNGEEEPYQDWLTVEGNIGANGYALGLLNNSTYSYDCLDGLLRTALIRSAPFSRHAPATIQPNDNNAWQDQGRQERTFWIVADRGNYSSLAMDRRAEEFQTPAEYVMDSAHDGDQAWEKSFLEVSPDDLWVLAIKSAEAGANALVVRIQERGGRPTSGNIKSDLLGINQTANFTPFEIKTLLIDQAKDASFQMREVSLLEHG